MKLPTPNKRSGWVFAVWYTAASGGTKKGVAGGSCIITADTTLYAHWNKCSHDRKDIGGAHKINQDYIDAWYNEHRNYHWCDAPGDDPCGRDAYYQKCSKCGYEHHDAPYWCAKHVSK